MNRVFIPDSDKCEIYHDTSTTDEFSNHHVSTETCLSKTHPWLISIKNMYMQLKKHISRQSAGWNIQRNHPQHTSGPIQLMEQKSCTSYDARKGLDTGTKQHIWGILSGAGFFSINSVSLGTALAWWLLQLRPPRTALNLGIYKTHRLHDDSWHPWDFCIFTYMNGCFLYGKCW